MLWACDAAQLPSLLLLLVLAAAAPQMAAAQNLYRINCGGNGFIDSGGNAWIGDRYFTGGTAYSNDNSPIMGTNDDTLYFSERNWDKKESAPGYVLPVTKSGRYSLRIHFAAICDCASQPGDRIFGLNLQEQELLPQTFDLVSEGGFRSALVYTVSVTVNPGEARSVRLGFVRVKGRPVISGIELTLVSEITTTTTTTTTTTATTTTTTTPTTTTTATTTR